MKIKTNRRLWKFQEKGHMLHTTGNRYALPRDAFDIVCLCVPLCVTVYHCLSLCTTVCHCLSLCAPAAPSLYHPITGQITHPWGNGPPPFMSCETRMLENSQPRTLTFFWTVYGCSPTITFFAFLDQINPIWWNFRFSHLFTFPSLRQNIVLSKYFPHYHLPFPS